MKLLPLLTLFLGVAASARAQWVTPPPPHIESLELTALAGKTIVTGTLAEVLETGKDGRGQDAVIAVKETLRGEPEPRLKVHLSEQDEVLARWRYDAVRLLVFVPNNPQDPTTVIDLSSKDLAVITADLRLLRTPAAVIAEVKRQSPSPGDARVEKFARSLPAWKVERTPLANLKSPYHPSLYLDVPVDRRLNEVARGEIRSADRDQRIEGIHILGLFKSEASVDALKSLLADEVGWSIQTATQEDELMRVRANPVRAAARQTLRSLGTDVPVTSSGFGSGVSDDERSSEVIGLELDRVPVTATEFEGLRLYPNLEELYLSGAKLTGEDFATVARQRSLKSLFLEGTNVADADLPSIAALPNLTYLALEATAISDAGLPELVKAKRLRRVDLGQAVTARGVAALRRARPDIEVHEDELAFLSPLHPRRTELPITFGSNWQFYGSTNRMVTVRRRSYVLTFSKETAAAVDPALLRELPKRGWKQGSPTDLRDRNWHRMNVLIGYEGGPEEGDLIVPLEGPFQGSYQWQFHLPLAAPGDYRIVVSRNVDLAARSKVRG